MFGLIAAILLLVKPPGDSRLCKRLNHALFFFIVLSPDSFASTNVDRELTLAERHNKTIIPIFHRTADIPDSMAYQLAGLQQLDFSAGDYDEKFGKLLKALTRLGFTIQEPKDDAEGDAVSTVT